MPPVPRKNPKNDTPTTPDSQRSRTLETLLRVGKDERHIVANPACETVLGLLPEQIVGLKMSELPVAPKLRKLWAARVKEVLETGQTMNVEDNFDGPAGPCSHETRLLPERDESGEVVSVLIVTHDVSERQRAERRLDLVVLVDFAGHGGGGVARFPAPAADGNKLQRHALVPAQAGTFAAEVKLVADADVGNDGEAGEAVG